MYNSNKTKYLQNTGDILAKPIFQNKKAKVVFKNVSGIRYQNTWLVTPIAELFHLFVKNVYDTCDTIHW